MDAFAAGRLVRDRRMLGSHASVVVGSPLTDGDLAWARELNLTLTPLSLQQAVVHASAGAAGERAERSPA